MGFKTLETRTMEFNGAQRQYHVVDRNIGQDAPQWFITYNNGLPFISDEVPENYREPMVFHEMMEFEPLKGQEGRCLKSLIAELETVPRTQKADYIQFRKKVFVSLLDYLKRKEPSSEMIQEATKSLEYLRGLQSEEIK